MVMRRFAPRYCASVEEVVQYCGLWVTDKPPQPTSNMNGVPAATTSDLAHVQCAYISGPDDLLAMSQDEVEAVYAKMIATLGPHERQAALNKRRITSKLVDMARKGLCAYCWLPASVCFCRNVLGVLTDPKALEKAAGEPVVKDGFLTDAVTHQLAKIALNRPDQPCCSGEEGHQPAKNIKNIPMSQYALEVDALRSSIVETAVIIHVDEFMRQSNTGHILGLLLDAPLLMWGFPAHDAKLASWGVSNERRGVIGTQHSTVAPVDGHTTTYLLYPSNDSHLLSSIPVENSATTIEESVVEVNKKAAQMPEVCFDTETTVAPFSPPSKEEPSDVKPTPKAEQSGEKPLYRLVLSDSTWGEAGAVNRRLMPSIPRVHVNVPEGYNSLFAPLRTQTRKSGVSTMEATAMALKSIMDATELPQKSLSSKMTDGGDGSRAGCGFTPDCVYGTLEQMMKDFVDVQCVQKKTPAVYNTALQDTLVKRLQVAQVSVHKKLMAHKEDRMEKDGSAEALKSTKVEDLYPSPVLLYCYPCKKYIPFDRMEPHCLGKPHIKRVERMGKKEGKNSMNAAWEAPVLDEVPDVVPEVMSSDQFPGAKQ